MIDQRVAVVDIHVLDVELHSIRLYRSLTLYLIALNPPGPAVAGEVITVNP